MSRNKFNLKDKKTKIIIGSTIIILLLLFLRIGLGLSSINNTDSKNIASQGQDKTENKKEDSKKKEESKKEETKVETSSTTTSEGTSSVENKSEGNKGTSNSNTSTGSSSSSSNSNTSSGSSSNSSSSSSSTNSGVSNNGGSSSSNSGSSNSNSGAVSTPSTPSKPSTGGSSSSGSSSSGNTAKPEAHSHSWNPITTTVHHDETGHWEDVLIQEAWTEYIPVYEEQAKEICNGCGADITADPYAHMEQQMDIGNMKCSGFYTDWRQVQVGTEEIKHGPVYDMKYVVDTPAWDETVVTGYQCSCGATK